LHAALTRSPRQISATIPSVVWLLASLATLWFALLLAAPFLPVPVSAAVYALGSYICHQRPERSFWVNGLQLPVCARCIGVYAGVVLGSAIAPILGRPRRPRAVILLSVVPGLGSWVAEWAELAHPPNSLRAATGVIAGVVIAAVVLATINYEQCARPRPIGPPRPPTPI
jgi:uncharacterized membrane protein